MHDNPSAAPAGNTVAIVGASSDRSKFGNKAIRAYQRQGWTVYPVNGRGGSVEGIPAFASLKDVPRPIRRVTLYLPPQLGLTALEEIAAVSPLEFFVNPGAESPELEQRAKALGLEPLFACSIIEIGVTPAQFPDT